MKTSAQLLALATVTLGLSPLGASALEVIDVDGDGTYSYEEILAVYPDLNAETFAAADTDTDGLISAEELAAANEAGIFPASS